MAPAFANEPCVLFALHREASALVRQAAARPRRTVASDRIRIFTASEPPFHLVETGLGALRMEKALHCLFGPRFPGAAPYRPAFILSAGFSGALQEQLQVGDVILATEVAHEGGEHWAATWPVPSAGEALRTVRRGRILSVTQLAGSAQEKRRLGREHDALAVDMETAAVARLCSAHGIPFGCLRVISDRLDTALSPRLISCLAGGDVSMPGLLAAVVRSPMLAIQMWRLARDTHCAAEHLARILVPLLQVSSQPLTAR